MESGAAWPRLAVLDVAGTVLDVADVIPDALRAAFAPLGVVPRHADVAALRGRSKREAVDRILADAGPTVGDAGAAAARTWERFHTELRRRLPENLTPIPGAAEVLGWLRREVGSVWLTTGLDRATLDLALEAVAWHGHPSITGTLSADDVARGRPAPDLVHAAMERAGIGDPAEVLVVGDTAADLEAAAAAGVARAVGVLSGAHDRTMLEARPHALLLASVADLPEWLAQADRRGTRTGREGNG